MTSGLKDGCLLGGSLGLGDTHTQRNELLFAFKNQHCLGHILKVGPGFVGLKTCTVLGAFFKSKALNLKKKKK